MLFEVSNDAALAGLKRDTKLINKLEGSLAYSDMFTPRGFQKMASKEQVFTIKELSEHLRVHPTTIYRLLRQGRLPGFRVGSNWRFNRVVIEEWETNPAPMNFAPTARGRRKRTGADTKADLKFGDNTTSARR